MATDGDIDFTTYTREQLDSAITRIDRERYPINARKLIDEYQRRKVEETGLARELAQSPHATHQVHFGNFWSGSKARNSFNLRRRGQIEISDEGVVVRAFRSEMLFMGARIELAFARAHIADVSQLANFVSFSIVRPNQDPEILGFWTQDEQDAEKIVKALPGMVSAAGVALSEYQAQLKELDRGDYATKALVAANILVFGAAGLAGAGFFVPNVQVLQAYVP